MRRPYLIAVAGGSGSGKTTFVGMLAKELASLYPLIITTDHYYRDFSHLSLAEREKLNFDCPESVELDLLLGQVGELCKGHSIQRPCYDFATHRRTPEQVCLKPAPVIIIDGIFSLCDFRLNELTDLKVYIDVDDDLRLARRMRRDVESRGRSMEGVMSQYFASVKPMHYRHIEPTKKCADLVVPWYTASPRAVGMVADLVQTRLARAISS